MALKSYHHKAVELRYAGENYREISKAIGGKISPEKLAQYFSIGGMLYMPYLEYEAKINKWGEQEARKSFKQQAGYVWKIKRSILQQAIKRGNLVLANNICNEILGFAGIVVENKTVVDDKRDKNLTYEQLLSRLTERGIDPRTGLRVATPPPQQN